MAWSGSYLAAGTTSGGVAIIEWPSKNEIAAWGVQTVPVISLAFSTKGDKLAIGVAHSDPNAPVEEAAFVWNYQSEPAPKPLRGHRLGVGAICFGKNDAAVITGSYDWTIRVWDVP